MQRDGFIPHCLMYWDFEVLRYHHSKASRWPLCSNPPHPCQGPQRSPDIRLPIGGVIWQVARDFLAQPHSSVPWKTLHLPHSPVPWKTLHYLIALPPPPHAPSSAGCLHFLEEDELPLGSKWAHLQTWPTPTCPSVFSSTVLQSQKPSPKVSHFTVITGFLICLSYQTGSSCAKWEVFFLSKSFLPGVEPLHSRC